MNNPTRIRIIKNQQTNNNNNNNNTNNTNNNDTNNNNNNSLKRKQDGTLQPASAKKLTLRLRPPPPQTQQLPASESSSSSSPLPPNPIIPTTPSLDQINQIRSYGLQLWYRIVNSTDADGRIRSIAFMDLPSAVDYPDYYQFIKHPIALNLIKAKLDSDREPYLSLDKLLSDLKLVFQNAKKYNVEYSGIYKDAQALLKIVRKDPFSNTNPQDHQNQAEVSEPKQKKLKLKLGPSQAAHHISPNTTHINGIDQPPATVIIPPTPVDPASHNGSTITQTQPEAPPAPPTLATRANADSRPIQQSPSKINPPVASGQLPSMSPQEVARIQAEVKAQTEARSRAQEEARQKELRAQDESQKQEEARQSQLRQQAQARQLELRQQAEAQQAQLRTQALPPTTRVQSQMKTQSHSQTDAPLPASLPTHAHPRSPARIQAQSQLQSPSRVKTSTIAQSSLPDKPSPITRASQARENLQGARPTTPPPLQAPPLSPSPPKPPVNLNKLRLWFRTILEHLEGVRDRTGRFLIEEFKTLPDKTRWKTYYQIIPEPIAIENIVARNSKQGYKDFESFQDDVLRMFKNAQHFNEDGSMVWNDSKTLEDEFANAIRNPPQELAGVVLPYLYTANQKKVNGAQPATPTGSINGRRRSPGKESPSRRGGPSSTLTAPLATAGLRRSSRSPSRPPSALGSPVTRSSRAVSPLPRRAPSPLGHPVKPTANNSTFVPPSRPPSRLANDISPALISISNGQSAARINESSGSKQIPGLKIRSMSVIPIKSPDGYPPMINRFRIISRPKTMETMKIKNKQVFQHAFKVPRTTETIVIESELNRAWPSTRQLRSSIGLMKVKVEQIRVRGVPERVGGTTNNTCAGNSSSSSHHPNGSSSLHPERELGRVFTELKLVDGLNLVELAVTGKPDANKNDLASPIINTNNPSSSSSASNSNPAIPLNNSSPPVAGLVRESYRLFIYR